MSEEQFRWPDNWDVALDAVRRCVRALGRGCGVNWHDIEDVLQTACLQIHIAAEATRGKTKTLHFDNLRKFCAWVKAVALNCIRADFRKKGRPLPPFFDVAPTDSLPENWIEEYIALVTGDRERQALRLFAQNESLSSIGRSLGVGKTQARNLLQGAFAQLEPVMNSRRR